MKIKRVRISNYRSLKGVTLDNLGLINTLAGKNGSGKSNLLEAFETFFREFDPAMEKPAAVPEHLWFGENTNFEISIELTIVLTGQEFRSICTENILKLLGEKEEFDVTIRRAISASQGKRVWRTIELKVDGLKLIEDNKTAAEFDTKLRSVVASSKTDTDLSQFLTALSSKTKNNFKLISPTRDQSFTAVTSIGERNPFLDTETQNAIRNLSQSTTPNEKKIWREIKEKVSGVLDGKDLEVSSNQIFLSEGNMKLPVYLHGGGQQEIVCLIRYIEELSKNGATIFAIEEPEMHLHPHAQRKLFEYIQEKSQTRQFFITTHSPIFLNKNGCAWLFQREDTETKITAIRSKEELKQVIIELGARPSDLLLADKVVFVEGVSDKIFLAACAEKLNIDFNDCVTLLPLRGIKNTRHNLKFWTDIAKDADIPIYVIADSGSQTDSELKDLLNRGLISSKQFYKLTKKAIEEYYPVSIVNSFLKDFGESAQLKSDFSIEQIDLKASKLIKHWKVPLAERVSQDLTTEQIPEEIGTIIRKISATE